MKVKCSECPFQARYLRQLSSSTIGVFQGWVEEWPFEGRASLQRRSGFSPGKTQNDLKGYGFSRAIWNSKNELQLPEAIAFMPKSMHPFSPKSKRRTADCQCLLLLMYKLSIRSIHNHRQPGTRFAAAVNHVPVQFCGPRIPVEKVDHFLFGILRQ